MDENKYSKVPTIQMLLYNGASASIVSKDVLYKRHRILKDKIINSLLWQGPFILLL